MTATVQEARILITDREITDIYEILPFIEEQMKPNKVRNFVIIAPDVKGNALASFIETKMKGGMNLLCVKAPSFGNLQKEMLQDLAIMTGGTFMANDHGKMFKDYTFDDLGFAKIVKSSEYTTTIMGLGGDPKKIKDRISFIKKQMEDPDTEFDREKLKERIAKMTGGVYVIKVGGSTEIEMTERKERVDDAILATQSAIKDKLGTSVDVTTSEQSAQSAVEPLQNIRTISLYSLIGSLVAGSIIIFLTMIMIVRERRREIGVLKAIGASNILIVSQFSVESLVLTLTSSIVGMILGLVLPNPILNVLVNNSTSSTSTTGISHGGFSGAGGQAMMQFAGGAGDAIRNLHATVGWQIIFYGLGAAVIIAIIGSALPAFFISKVRPAEVLRSE